MLIAVCQGHKESGESGIFPQVYTSANPPAPSIESVKISENLTRGTKYSTSSTSAKLDAIGHVRASSHLPERDPVQQDSLSASAPPSSKSESQMSVLQDPNRRWGNASTDCTPPPPSSQSASWIQRTRARSRLASRAKSQTNRQQRHLNMDAATAASQAAPGDLDNPQEVSEPLQSVQKTKRPALQQDTVTPRSSNDNAPPIDTNVTQYTSSGASADTSLSHTADKTPQLPGPQAFTTIGNVSPTDESRPPSSTRLSQESSIYGRTKSIRSIDTSPTTSLKGHFLPTNDPRNWTVEQVVAWAASKEYGDLTQAKLSGESSTHFIRLS